MRKFYVIMTAALLAVSLTTVPAFANAGYGYQGKSMSTEKKIYKKVHMLSEHQQEVGVSDDQLKKLKALKLALKKDLIKMDADIDVVKLDIKAAMAEDTIDLNALNALVDRKYEVKKARAKRVMAAYAELKNALSKDQKTKLKALYMQKGYHQAGYGKK